ncbi:MAG: HAD family phosphatase [Bacteroidales bacterium]|nr:HAD family phosphatase [Bacteroidales bacterium]
MIKNIIFDFGGVIHDIRYENVTDAIALLGISGMDGFYSKNFQTHEMDLFEKGLISPVQYRDYIRRVSGHPELSDQQIDDVTNAILIDVPKERVALLLALRHRYRVFLFSNTNQINYDCFTRRLCDKYGFDIFDACFERAYFSQMMHTRKPSPEGFRHILSENNLSADETLFIDDIAANAEGARQAGIHAYHLATGNIISLFDDGFALKKTLLTQI